jgi:signal transduction histidine kinase
LHVSGDAVRLERIIGNLLHNASKYSDDRGNVWLTIERHSSGEDARTQNEVVISVRDCGIGIEPEKLRNVFDLFMRATRSIDDQRYGGLGVGLTLVRRLVELHRGTSRREAPVSAQAASSSFDCRPYRWAWKRRARGARNTGMSMTLRAAYLS